MALDIRGILEAYKHRLRAPQKTVIAEIVRAYNATGLSVSERDLSYTPSTRTVTIRAMGPLKIEMLLRKVQVLREACTTLNEKDIPLDII